MKKLHITLLAVNLVGAVVVKGQVPAFVNPPESTSSSTWIGQAGYQRDIYLNFSENPVGNSTPPTGGIPGAVYAGTQDSLLLGSDYVTFTGAFQYYSAAQSPDGIAGIGIVNTAPEYGGAALSGAVNIYLNTTAGAENNLWLEAIS